MRQRIGYVHLSSSNQILLLLRKALQEAGCLHVYEESINNRKGERVELVQCLKMLKSGDTLVVWGFSCLASSLSDLVNVINALKKEKYILRV